ncbi:MAG: hypothetical protein ACI8WB_005234 [Phenylobacterium sp.]|jgi:hypothetical protein
MSVFTELKAGIADLTTVEVQTFTGNLSTIVSSDANSDSVIDWQVAHQTATEKPSGAVLSHWAVVFLMA